MFFDELKKLNEARPTNTFGIVQELRKLPSFDKLIKVESRMDGMVAAIRTKDGQAYEIVIRPVQYAKEIDVPNKKKGK